MAETARVTECPYPMHKSQREKIREKAEELGLSDTHIFSLVMEEGLESLSEK